MLALPVDRSLLIALQGETLSVIQQSFFLTLPLISLPFRKATNEEITAHLVSIIRKYQEAVSVYSHLDS